MNIIQENNWVITTKKGKGKLSLLCGNIERVIPIYSLICSLDYLLLKYGQDQGLFQCKKPLATVMFGVVQNMF